MHILQQLYLTNLLSTACLGQVIINLKSYFGSIGPAW